MISLDRTAEEIGSGWFGQTSKRDESLGGRVESLPDAAPDDDHHRHCVTRIISSSYSPPKRP